MSIRFAAVGFQHNHIHAMIRLLEQAGARLVSFFEDDPALAREAAALYPRAAQARSVEDVLADESISLIVSAAVPDRRAALGIAAMQHGKDYLVAKPGFTTLEALEDVRRVQAQTGRHYVVYFSERFGSRATIRASELVAAGAIGRVVQTVGLGPHRVDTMPRPAWFYDSRRYGGILNDLASHQIDQFLHFTGSTSADIATAHVGNVAHGQYPAFQDFGEVLLVGKGATGYIRVDWLAPAGLATWGDVRLFILGTEGTIELRKNEDVGGKPGGDHLFLADHKGTHYLDCSDVPLDFGRQLIGDVLERTNRAISQAHVFAVSELALKAQARAVLLTGEDHDSQQRN